MFKKAVRIVFIDMKKIKEFLVENGIVSVLALGICVVAFILGKGFLAAVALGFFLGRNNEIIKKLYAQYLQSKVVKALNKK